MAWDASDGYVLLFGGGSYARGQYLLADTWTYVGGAWTQLFPSVAPSARDAEGLAYDPALGKVVMFSGYQDYLTGGSFETNDTWTYHAGVWANVTGGPAPPGIWGEGMVYDTAASEIVLFGGFSDALEWDLNETWTYTASGWSRLSTPVAPAPRERAGMAYDVADSDVVLFGGYNASTEVDLNDTWTFDSGHWTNITQSPAPVARSGFGMAYSAALGKIFLFGGFNDSTNAAYGDTWSFTGDTWTQLTPTLSPANRSETTLVNDEKDGTLLLFGGQSIGRTGNRSSWSFDGTTWTEVLPTAAPTGSGFDVATYDGQDGYVVLFGGYNATGNFVNTTWTFADGVWHQLFPATAPSPRELPALVYDPSLGKVVLFGGYAFNPHTAVAAFISDTWTFSGGTWTNVTSTAGTPPLARFGAGATYDPTLKSVLLFGGESYNTTSLQDEADGDTWTFNGTWTNLLTSSPGARYGAGLAWDPELGGDLLFGGFNESAVFGDTWLFIEGGWSPLFPAGSPTTRGWMGMTFDPETGSVILTGGYAEVGEFSVGPMNDTWTFANGTWTMVPQVTLPAARYASALFYDPSVGKLINWGGENDGMALGDSFALEEVRASASATPTSGTAPLTVAFAGSGSGGQAPYSYLWNFADGTVSNASAPSHTFGQAGNYTVSLTVTDTGGVGATTSLVVQVTPALIVNAFLAPTKGVAPLTVTYSVVVDGSAPTAGVSWTFGDGVVSSVPDGNHTYAGAGTYSAAAWVNESGAAPFVAHFVVTVTASSGGGGTSPGSSTSSSSLPSSSYLWLGVGIVVGAVLGVLAGLLAFRRKTALGGGGPPPSVTGGPPDTLVPPPPPPT